MLLNLSNSDHSLCIPHKQIRSCSADQVTTYLMERDITDNKHAQVMNQSRKEHESPIWTALHSSWEKIQATLLACLTGFLSRCCQLALYLFHHLSHDLYFPTYLQVWFQVSQTIFTSHLYFPKHHLFTHDVSCLYFFIFLDKLNNFNENEFLIKY